MICHTKVVTFICARSSAPHVARGRKHCKCMASLKLPSAIRRESKFYAIKFRVSTHSVCPCKITQFPVETHNASRHPSSHVHNVCLVKGSRRTRASVFTGKHANMQTLQCIMGKLQSANSLRRESKFRFEAMHLQCLCTDILIIILHVL